LHKKKTPNRFLILSTNPI